MYVPKITKATIQAAAINASAQSHMAYSGTGSLGTCASACSLIFTIRGQTPDFAGISPSTFKMNCTSFVSRFKFMLDPKECQKQLLVLSAKQSEPLEHLLWLVYQLIPIPNLKPLLQ
jgi:hypothetical protein